MALHIWELLTYGFYQTWIENIRKNSESYRKQNEFAAHSNLFTQHLHCTRYYKYSRDDLKHTGVCMLGYMLDKELEHLWICAS